VIATVGPRTTTLALERYCAASKNDPVRKSRLFVLAQMSVVPIVVADRSVTLLLMIGAVPVEAGVTVATAGAFASASASAAASTFKLTRA
jgi:hypothetical protein